MVLNDEYVNEDVTENCPLCRKVFTGWGKLSGHLIYQHLRSMVAEQGWRAKYCEICQKEFCDQNRLLGHVWSSHKDFFYPDYPEFNRRETKKN